MSIAVDDAFVYLGTYGGIVRAALDGTGVTMLAAPDEQVTALAVDAHALYFSQDGAIRKIDKQSGVITKMVDLTADNGLLVRGGNLYWASSSGGALGAPLMKGGVYTTCK